MAMPWSKSAQGLPELDSIEDCASVMKGELVVLFKHSPTCPVSWMAHREVMQYRSDQPEIPIYLVSVRRRREVSRHIAEQTGIHHESPQIIVLRRGEVIATASHDEVTADTITAFVGKSSPKEVPGLGAMGTQESVPSAAPSEPAL
jgi:bacillithiol system protein YtxJ